MNAPLSVTEHLPMADERIVFLQRNIIQRDAEIQRLERCIERARDLLSGEFYNEALGELEDAIQGSAGDRHD